MRIRFTASSLAVGVSSLLLASISVYAWAAPAPAPAKTAAAAAQLAISTNPEVEAAWHAFLAAGDEQRSARGGYYPQVDLGASVGVEDFEVDEPVKQDTDFHPAGVNLTVTQLLYDGFATQSNVARLGHARRERYFDLLNAAETAALEAVKAYDDVNRYRELVALAERNVGRHGDVLGLIKRKVSAGVGRSVDQEQATGRAALAESNLVTEQSNLHDVSARYQRVVGQWPAEGLAPSEHVGKPLPVDIVAALKLAHAYHPALAAAAENIKASQEQLRNRRSLYHPRIDLRLRGDYGDDLDRIEGETTDTRAEVLLNYNLFNGGSDKAAISQATNLIEVSEDQRESTCREVRQNLRIAFNDRQRIGTQLDYLKVHKDTTDKSRTAYFNQFQIGQRTLLDLLDTENEYFEAQRAFVNGNYDLSIASARTLAGMGGLREAIGITRASQPPLSSLGGPINDGLGACPADPLQDEPIQVAVVTPPPPVATDSDGDGVPDIDDLCPGTPPGTPVDAVGCAHKQQVVLKGVMFEFNSTALTEPSKELLNNSARILHDNPKVRVEVAGHTDNVGSPEYNIRLSQGRAASVVNYLVSQGVGAGQLQARGYGLTQPKTTNDTADGRAINRRVEFRIQDSK